MSGPEIVLGALVCRLQRGEFVRFSKLARRAEEVVWVEGEYDEEGLDGQPTKYVEQGCSDGRVR